MNVTMRRQFARRQTVSDDNTQFDRRTESRQGKGLRAVLLDSVMHEFRTPLTSIKVSVTALLENSLLQPSQCHELLVIIDEEADRLNRLVGEAAETAQLGLGLKLSLKPHAIEEIIYSAIDDCEKLLGRRSVSVQISPGLKPVRADVRHIKKALGLLLENAAKYSRPAEPITITAELNGGFVITSVADRGSGINESEQVLIFEKFYRGEDHRDAVPGTGMGLPIASAIIRAHGGSLTVTSERGHGSIFSFSLPICSRSCSH